MVVEATAGPRGADTTTRDGVEQALQQGMPGVHPAATVTKMHQWLENVRQGVANRPEQLPGWVATVREEVSPLLQVVDLHGCGEILDPFSGWGAIKQCLREEGWEVKQNDLNPIWQAELQEDAAQPSFYRKHCVDAVITSPPFALLDLVVPLLAAAVRVVACVHVPGLWVTSAPAARQAWLTSLAAAGRLHLVVGLPR